MQLSRTALTLMMAAAMTSTAFAAGKMNNMAEMNSVKIPMHAENGSKEDGTATLTQKGKDLQVVIDLSNAPKMAQPAHIHDGSCTHLNPVPKYPLNNVVGGKSTTTLKNINLAKLMGKTAINVHKSANDLKTYVSCGEIKK